MEILTPGTRRVVQALLDKGAATANEVAGELQLTSAAIRHHLEWLVEQNYVVASDQPAFGPRVTKRRGRPSKFFTLTNAGRQAFDQKYDDLAQTAFRWAAEKYGESAIKEIAQKQMDFQKNRWTSSINGEDLRARVNQLTNVLTKEGYAASVTDSQSPIVQLSFHRCPIEDVASEFPAICEAEMCAIGEAVGGHVTRIATIANGADICTAIVSEPAIFRKNQPIKITEGAI